MNTDFDIKTVDDEIRVDGLCRGLLEGYYLSMTGSGITPVEATLLANGADLYLRDFVVAVKNRNLFDERPGLIRQFGGNWYIVFTYEPKIEILADHLRGIAGFYRYLGDCNLISEEFKLKMMEECDDIQFYRERIDSFFDITGGGYLQWERACTLKD